MDRVQILLEQRRYADAEKELRIRMASDPTDTITMGLLALCLAELKRDKEAAELINAAVGMQPDSGWLLYIKAKILLEQDNEKEALNAIQQAVIYDPWNADYFGMYAAILLSQKEWERALDMANQGLAIDSENVTCLNLRSTALIKLDRKQDAYDTINEALFNDPNNPNTHANLGWGLLEKGDHQKSLIHFRQALQLDPENEWAKAGLVEGLKARYFIYRLFLRYQFWMGNMKDGMQWGIILGFYFGSRLLNYVSRSYPALEPFIFPIIVLYILFALSTWIMTPLSNLFLRLNVYGRYALTKEETTSSTLVGISLGIGLLALIPFAVTGIGAYGLIAVFGISMMIPLGGVYRGSQPSSHRIAQVYALAMLVVGCIAIAQVFMHPDGDLGPFAFAYLGMFFVYQWVGNWLASR